MTHTVVFRSPAPKSAFGKLRGALSDTSALTGRNLLMFRRVPQLLVFATIQPVIFVLMFRYVFGGAILVPNEQYVDYLMPGVFAQTVTFGAIGTAVGLATDLKTGFVERFKSLPMSHSSVLVARILSDLARNVFVISLMGAIGFAVGFHYHTSFGAFALALVLLLIFGVALSFVFATVGIIVRDPETAQAAAFPVIAPLVFASSAFVPVRSMPGWLQPFAEHQPVSAVITAARALVLGGPVASDLLTAVAWCVGIVAVFAPAAVFVYRRAE
jgi:ABC-2 type transport system permease protein/oleandomycin transport system permease protein